MALLQQQIKDLAFPPNEKKNGNLNVNTNLQIIFDYFGLGDVKYPTNATLSVKHKLSRSRPQEIVKDNILKKQSIKPTLASLTTLEQTIEHSINKNGGYALYSDVLSSINTAILDKKLHPRGLFNLARYFNFNVNFVIVHAEKNDEDNFINHSEFILARESLKEKIRDDLKEILDLPGSDRKPGIFLLNSVFQTENSYLLTFENAKKILRGHKDVWYYEENGNFWYVLQQFGTKKGNSLITALRKIKKVGGNHSFEKTILIEVVYKALSRQNNQEVRDAIFPPIHIIRKYFDESRYISSDISDIKYVLNENLDSNISLAPVEQNLWDYFKDREIGTLQEITAYIKDLDKDLDLGAMPRSCLLVEVQKDKKGNDRVFVFITKYDSKKFRYIPEDSVDKKNSRLGDKKNRKQFDNDKSGNETNKKRIGYEGERLVFHCLQQEKNISDLEWVSEEYPNAPYDIKFTNDNNHTYYIDVKSTEDSFNSKIYISYNELYEMLEIQENETYQIYRVYGLDESYSKGYLQVSENLQNFARNTLEVLNKLPKGIYSEGISLLPTAFIQFDIHFGVALPISYEHLSSLSDDMTTVHRPRSTPHD